MSTVKPVHFGITCQSVINTWPGQSDKMTSVKFSGFLLCVLLLCCTCSEEPEIMFRAQGGMIEMGYCFGVDYIVVYRCDQEGDQLLGNSSVNVTVTPPADLRNRIRINQHHHLLGLQILNLTHMDSGMYRRECWQNQKLVSKVFNQLFVCDEEVPSIEVIVKEGDAEAELQCKSSSSGLEGTFVRWFLEKYPLYKPTLFLDTSISLKPQVKELQGVMKVRDGGLVLGVDNSVWKTTQYFHCQIMQDKKCLSFQNMYLPDNTENKDIFTTQGARLVLQCPSDGDRQQWETPLGNLDSKNTRLDGMYISTGSDFKEFSLVIPAVTEDHSGEYSCISSSLELQYMLFLCPKMNPLEKVALEGKNVSLVCKVNQARIQKVQWYRKEMAGEYNVLIQDSGDRDDPNLSGLKGRVTLADNGSSLTISKAEMKDGGEYWCIVLGGTESHDDEDNYDYEYDEEDTENEEVSDYQYWPNTDRCLFKQETILKIIKPVTVEPRGRNEVTVPADESPSSSNTALYAAAGGAAAVVLLLAAVIAAVIVLKKKHARASQTNKDKINNDDPDCDMRLTSEECNR